MQLRVLRFGFLQDVHVGSASFQRVRKPGPGRGRFGPDIASSYVRQKPVVFVGQETATGLRRQIWFQPYPEGEPPKISNDLNEYSSLSVTADGKSFVTTQDRPAAVICGVSRPEGSQTWSGTFYFRNIAISPTRRYSSR